MADINLIRSHSLALPEAKKRVQKAADELAQEHDLHSEWHGNALRFDRTGLHGEVHVTHSHIQLEATLGLLFKPLKGTLVSEIERKFDKLFPEAKAGLHKAQRKRTSTAQ